MDLARTCLERLRDRPAEFQRLVLGRELWSRQRAVCDAVARSPIAVVPAGRAVGKSFLLAGLVLWWLYTRPMSQVITTGPDHRQVVSVLWKELRRALRNSRAPLGWDHLTEGYSSPQRLVVRAGTEWGALGFATRSAEGLSGQHAPELLVIADESSGIQAECWDAIHGLAASRLVLAGNPIKYDCHFRELHDLAGKPGIESVPISSLDHPHATLERSPIGAVSRPWLEQQRAIHGEHSPWWRSNVLGLFPGAESVSFIPVAWLDACVREEVIRDDLWLEYPGGAPCMGVDVGGGVGADRSVVVVRDRRGILEIFASEWHGVLDDARHRLEPIVLALASKWGVAPDRIVYDKAGLGRSFGSYLSRERSREIERWWAARADQPRREDLAPRPFGGACGYFGGGRGGKLYVNRRTACAFALKARLDPHRDGHIPFSCGGLAEWPALREELAALRSPAMEMEEGEVKQRLEEKSELMGRLKRSPDLLDALLMSFHFPD